MAIITQTEFQRRKRARRIKGQVFHAMCLGAILIGIGMLAALLYNVLSEGLTRLSWDFLTSFPSRFPERAGIQAALLGSIYVVGIAGVLAFTLGVGAAIYLEEYASRSWFARIIQINIANLAACRPSCTESWDWRSSCG